MSLTLGQQLRAARERKQVTCSQAAAASRIQVQQLEALERDDYRAIAAPVYARGFIRLYADYLGLDPAPLLQLYQDQYAPTSRPPLVTKEEGRLAPPTPAPTPPRPPRPAAPGPAGKPDAAFAETADDAAPAWRWPLPRLSAGQIQALIYGAVGLLLLVVLAVGLRQCRRVAPPVAGETPAARPSSRWVPEPASPGGGPRLSPQPPAPYLDPNGSVPAKP